MFYVTGLVVAHPSPAFSFATVDTIDYCDVTASNVYCSDDSWRDTFFEKHEHSTLWLLICGTIEKHLLTYKCSIYWHCSCGMQSRVSDTIVCLSRHVCGWQPSTTSSCAAAWHSSANASSVTFTADVGNWTQTGLSSCCILCLYSNNNNNNNVRCEGMWERRSCMTSVWWSWNVVVVKSRWHRGPAVLYTSI